MIMFSFYCPAMLMKQGFNDIISQILIKDVFQSNDFDSRYAKVFQNASVALRGLCIHDDLRREMSCAYDNGKFFLNATGVAAALLSAASCFEKYPEMASSALLSAKALITTEESVKIMAQHGAMTLPKQILAYEEATPELIRSMLGLMRNLCADDIRKSKLAQDGTLEMMLRAIVQDKNMNDGPLVENFLAVLAAMTLRSPSNAQKIVAVGAMEWVCRGMQRHEDRVSLLRQGSLAIRNIAARCPDLRSHLLDAGVETVLRNAGKYQYCVDEAYGALRDLGCDVQRVMVNEAGQVEGAFQQFGQRSNNQFRPVFEASNALESRIQSESRAPFARNTSACCDHEDQVNDHCEDENCLHSHH